jgi:hypothetical protein
MRQEIDTHDNTQRTIELTGIAHGVDMRSNDQRFGFWIG